MNAFPTITKGEMTANNIQSGILNMIKSFTRQIETIDEEKTTTLKVLALAPSTKAVGATARFAKKPLKRRNAALKLE